MPRSNEQVQASEIAQIKRAVKDLQQGRLKNASMHGTRLYIYDDDGDIREVIGNQGDGSYGSRVVKSPPQPTPTAPVVPVASEEERVPNVFPVEWDGGIVQGQLPVVHGRTDVWTQRADSVDDWDPELAKLAGSIRDQQGGATSIVVEGSGTYLVALQMVGADRVTKGDFSEPSLVEVSARVDAEDIDDRLNAFADGELEDAAYENLMARLGEFMHVRADQIDVNSLAADAAFIGYLEAAGIVLSNEAGRRRFEVSGDGFRLTDTETDQVVAQLGTQSDDLISLHDSETGEMVISMSQDGGVASRALSVDSDPSFGGKRLAGGLYGSPRWHSGDSVFDMSGGHIVGHHRRSFSGDTSGNSGNGQSIAHLEAFVEPGRMYAIRCHDFQMDDRRDYFLEAFYETSEDNDVRPNPPNRSSLTWGASPGRVPPAGSGDGTTLSFDRVVTFNTIQRIRINFVVGVYSSSGTLSFGRRQRHAPHFTITDLGPNLGSSGANLWQSAFSSTASVPAPRSFLRELYPVARTATYTLSNSGVATRQYTNGEMRFGRWRDGNTYVTVMEFAPWNQPGVPQSVDLRFRVDRWRTPAGNIVQLGLPGFSGTPASFNYGNQVEALHAARNVGTVAPTGVNLGRSQQLGLASRSAASLVLGGSGWSDSPFPASGVATTRGVTTALSTDVSGQTTGEGYE